MPVNNTFFSIFHQKTLTFSELFVRFRGVFVIRFTTGSMEEEKGRKTNPTEANRPNWEINIEHVF